MQKLTAKQEHYIQGLISGLSQREAYRQAYPSSRKWKDNVVDSKASDMLKNGANGKVLERYEEVLAEHKNKALWTREQAAKELLSLLEEAKNDMKEVGLTSVSKSALIDAIRELNKIEGINTTREEQRELIKAQTEHIKAKTKLIVGVEHDFSLMQSLVDVVKGYEPHETNAYSSYNEWLLTEGRQEDGPGDEI